MAKFIASPSEDFVVTRSDDSFGSVEKEILKVDGKTGKLVIGGQPAVGSTAGNLAVGGDLAVTGKAGFNGSSPVAKAAAYTQTYATASRTMPAATSHTITDSSGGTASTSTLAAVTSAANAGSADVAPVANNFATLEAELALTKADLAAAKQVVNSLIDDLRALGLVG